MKQVTTLIFILLVLLTSCGGNTTNTTEKTNANNERWYEGGTLHKAKISEWKAATEENKLATCADFMATVDNTVSMEVLKKRAMELMKCIDEATNGLDITNDESVASVASKCTVLLGY